MNNAMVTLPLSEVDAIRNSEQRLAERVQDLESKQRMIKVEVKEQIQTYQDRYGVVPGTKRIIPIMDWQAHPHIYVNMDDVIAPIREEEKHKLQSFIDERTRRVSQLENQLNINKTEHKEVVRELKELYEQKLRLRAVSKLQGENLRNKLDEVSAELRKFKNMSFVDRIFYTPKK